MGDPGDELGRLARGDKPDLAYAHRNGIDPGVLFLPGFNSDMQGTKALALEHPRLHREIGFAGPVRLLHGQSDEDVPWELSLALVEKLASRNIELTLIKEGDHRLSADTEIERLLKTVERLLATICDSAV
jgi:alpha-beta hydrolase superfamily lysophospholipase